MTTITKTDLTIEQIDTLENSIKNHFHFYFSSFGLFTNDWLNDLNIDLVMDGEEPIQIDLEKDYWIDFEPLVTLRKIG